MGAFLVLELSVLGLFLFCFSLVWGEQATDAQDFCWQSKGEDHFRSWFPFFFCLLGGNSVFVQMLSGPKTFMHISSIFFRSLIRNLLPFLFLLSLNLWLGIFSFCFLPLFWLETFLFLFSSEGKDWHSHPGSRFMVSWDFGSRLVERLDMIYVRVWPAVRG